MTFRTRNLYYLRISEKTVLPIYASRIFLQILTLSLLTVRV